MHMIIILSRKEEGSEYEYIHFNEYSFSSSFGLQVNYRIFSPNRNEGELNKSKHCKPSKSYLAMSGQMVASFQTAKSSSSYRKLLFLF